VKPDYSSYSDKELQEALSTIDREAYPERVQQIESEIGRREASAPVEEEAAAPAETSPSSGSPFASLLKAREPQVGIYLIVSSLLTFAQVADNVQITGTSPSWGWLMVAVPLASYVGMFIAGIGLVASRYWARGLAVLSLGVQVPIFRFSLLNYVNVAAPALELKLWPGFGFSSMTSPALNIQLLDSPESFYLGVNVIAVFCLVVLTYQREA
jgi:hypothetical protein